MKVIKCICNGSRGTDCDYCAGSGYITEPIHIPGGSQNQLKGKSLLDWSRACRILQNKIEILDQQVDKLIRKGKPANLQVLEGKIEAVITDVFEFKKRIPLDTLKNYDSLFINSKNLKAKFTVKKSRALSSNI